MLNTLIESKSHRKRNTSGAIAAVCAHALIVAAAAYATANAAPSAAGDPIEVIHIAAPRRAASKPAPARPRTSTHAATAHLPSISVSVAPNLPPIDIPLAVPSSSGTEDFAPATGAPSDAPPGDARTFGSETYDATEVESQVAVKSGFRPEYPAAMRASGAEGRVVVQFIVNAEGKTDSSSIRILSSTNEMFAESVRRALIKSRFQPATIGGKSVAQLVQQLFVFRLDR